MSNKIVLVVDDSMLSRNFIVMAVQGRAGVTVAEARDGDEAWKAIEEQSVALVLTDLNMPNLDGIGLTRRIRDGANTRELPVVLITTLSEQARSDEAREAGVDAFLTKPVTAASLNPLLELYLSDNHSGDSDSGE